LSGKANSGTIEGDILMNNTSLHSIMTATGATRQCFPSIAYVMQSDAHIPSLTVKETLTFAAMLRLREYRSGSIAVTSAVDWVLQLLSLRLVENNLIGSGDHMNLSVGQVRRLTIGVELVSRPSLIFLDEPTSVRNCFWSYLLIWIVFVNYIDSIDVLPRVSIVIWHRQSSLA
jgi:ABC-type multidrug transport system ATPase subunit